LPDKTSLEQVADRGAPFKLKPQERRMEPRLVRERA
jgi:hypothetical protein